MKEIRIKRLSDGAALPSFATEGSAAADLYLSETAEIPPHGTVSVPTGVSIEIPNGYAGLLIARSGLAARCGLSLANGVGLIDSDYRGEIRVLVHNSFDSVCRLERGARIAQLLIIEYERISYKWSQELSETSRGSGGFGSTGE